MSPLRMNSFVSSLHTIRNHIPLNQLEGTFRASPEGARVSGIENLYTNYFGRAPDASGVRYYYDLFGDTIDDSELFFFLDTVVG